MEPIAYPKISIVTPSYNQAAYLEQTILSVLDQDYPNLEYIVIDGGSSDRSVEIIKKYADRIHFWVSEKDEGLYHAIQKGFEHSTGEIMGWINSDDMLHRNSLFSVAEILSLQGVAWIQGTGTLYDEKGRTVRVAPNKKWSKYHYLLGDFQWIQQESTFWKRNLWEMAGGRMTTKYKYAGELELWNRFFKYEKLYSLTCLIGGFRIRTKDQLSLDNSKEYFTEVESILKENVPGEIERKIINGIKRIDALLRFLSKTRVFNIFFITLRLKNKKDKLYDYPKEVLFNREKQMFFISQR